MIKTRNFILGDDNDNARDTRDEKNANCGELNIQIELCDEPQYTFPFSPQFRQQDQNNRTPKRAIIRTFIKHYAIPNPAP